MNPRLRTSLVSGTLLITALSLLSSCNQTSTTAQAATDLPRGSATHATRSTRSLPSGTTINVRLGSNLSSETANVGDAWHGTVTEEVRNRDESVISPGSDVSGVVTGVTPARRGSRAMIELGIRSVRVNGRDESIAASSPPVIAGSTRARNLGAIAGGAAAGALIGKVVGNGKNAAVGGLIGGAAATGVVAGSKGYQVELHGGAVMSFTVNQTVAMR